MDNKTAGALLASMLERASRDQTLGTVSKLEREAIVAALKALGYEGGVTSVSSDREATAGMPDAGKEVAAAPPARANDSSAPSVQPPVLPSIELALDSLDRRSAAPSGMLMCLDFGTAMSKAFALSFPDDYIELELGAAAGREGYVLPSSVFIADDGKAFFGFEAIEMSEGLVGSGRHRLDSIKGWLSLRKEGNLDSDACLLDKTLNPTSYKLTQGDLIRIYLAYLTDTAELALARHQSNGREIGRSIKRRFARPCWPDPNQAKWADGQMRELLADAQILADTFSGNWAGGIEVARLKAALVELKSLGQRPDYLIDDGVPEPVAVAAGAIAEARNMRDAFMVVDAGAGTTDFGLFVAVRRPGDAGAQRRVFQINASISGLMQAGDKVDGMLRMHIAHKERIDANDTQGRMIMADLTRRIRGMKELLFRTGRLDYVLADETTGTVDLAAFLADEKIQQFGRLLREGFVKALAGVDQSWLNWLAMQDVRLHVVLTGGSSTLPMVKALANGPIDVNGFRIMRAEVDSKPDWMDAAPEAFLSVYPQLAVAIGGTAEQLPETLEGPVVFGGGAGRARYVAGRLQITGA